MKAHAPHEPVIPPEARRRLLVVGASGFGRPIEAAAHRPERYAALAGAALADPVTPQTQAAVMLAENLHDGVYVNQVETPAAWAAAEELARRLNCPVTAGSLHQGLFPAFEVIRGSGPCPMIFPADIADINVAPARRFLQGALLLSRGSVVPLHLGDGLVEPVINGDRDMMFLGQTAHRTGEELHLTFPVGLAVLAHGGFIGGRDAVDDGRSTW